MAFDVLNTRLGRVSLASFLRVFRRVSLASFSFVCVSLAQLASFSGVWYVSLAPLASFSGAWCVSFASFSVCVSLAPLASFSGVWGVLLASFSVCQVCGVFRSLFRVCGMFRSLRSQRLGAARSYCVAHDASTGPRVYYDARDASTGYSVDSPAH